MDQFTGFSYSSDLYDNFHPLPSGEEKMASKWYAALRTVLGNGVASPDPTPPTVPVVSGVYQAEAATLVRSVVYNGYVVIKNASGDSIEWTVHAPAGAGAYYLDFRYAMNESNRPLEIRVNNAVIATSYPFVKTGGWETFKMARLAVTLNSDINTIKASSIGLFGPNLDSLTVTKQ